MTYSIEWDRQPLKFLQKLERKDAKRILDKVDEILLDPFHYLEHQKNNGPPSLKSEGLLQALVFRRWKK